MKKAQVRAMNIYEIIKKHDIQDVVLKGKTVTVNEVHKYEYTNSKIAKAVYSKLKMFKGV